MQGEPGAAETGHKLHNETPPLTASPAPNGDERARRADEENLTSAPGDAGPNHPGADASHAGQATETAAPPRFQSLDRRVITLWRINHAISSAILLGLASLGGLFLVVSVRGSMRSVLIGLALLTLLRVFLWFWYPPRAYRAWGYRLDEKVLETRSGVVFYINQLLPLSRLQHVDLHRGPIERSFGLASLLLHSAGTNQSTIVIPGLEAGEAARLRDQLVTVGGDDAV